MVKDVDEKKKLERMLILKNQAFKNDSFEYDDSFESHDGSDPLSCKTTDEIVKCLERNENCTIEARVIGADKDGNTKLIDLDKKEFIEAFKFGEQGKIKLKESNDYFGMDSDASPLVGQDYIPMLGGPFNKQQYYKDYLKGHATAFYYFHHDPYANLVVKMTRDFTLGRGFRVDFKNPLAQATWEAFSEINNLPQMLDYIAFELSLYGEIMLWWLPQKETYISYQLSPKQAPPKAFLPRFRLIDPSVIWEIVTYPEDITRVLYYQWVAPTQWSMYTGRDKGETVPGTKFIYQQIPADQVDHFKINVVSNEKRGRSDLFPAFGYFKRFRDSINYAIVSMQKNAAWAIDTTIDGDMTDINNYVASQEALGTIPEAGSEFVHSKQVTRQYLSNLGGGKGANFAAFEWSLSSIASATGWPVSYFGTHLSGGQTRASALVATEPIAKKIEQRQLIYDRIIVKIAKRLLEPLGLYEKPEITFPEVITQDRSQKLKDIAAAQMAGWISKERAAEIAAKELNITEFDYKSEKLKIEQDQTMSNYLTSPLTSDSMLNKSASAVTSNERQGIKDADGF